MIRWGIKQKKPGTTFRIVPGFFGRHVPFSYYLGALKCLRKCIGFI